MRREIMWASFGPGVRISGSSSESPAAAKSDSCAIFKDVVEGEVCLVIEDRSLRASVIVPWHNVGSVEYAPVAIESAPAKKAAAKPVVEHQQ